MTPYMRVLVPTLACVAALCLTAGPAAAKAGLEVSAVPVTVGGVPTDEVSVIASGGDDGAGYQRLCLQQFEAAAWRTIACGRVRFGDGGSVQAFVQHAEPGSEEFRAELQRVARVRRGITSYVVDLTSAPVRVRAPAADADDAPLSLDYLMGLAL